MWPPALLRAPQASPSCGAAVCSQNTNPVHVHRLPCRELGGKGRLCYWAGLSVGASRPVPRGGVRGAERQNRVKQQGSSAETKELPTQKFAYAVYCSRKHVVRSALSQRATEGKSAPQHEKETRPRGIRTPNCKVCARLLKWYLPESQLSTAVRSRGEISTLWKPSFNGRKRVLL